MIKKLKQKKKVRFQCKHCLKTFYEPVKKDFFYKTIELCPHCGGYFIKV